MNPYEELTRLRDEWNALQPMKPEDERRLWRKLKLEWSYHSNHIEGNTLTYGETELLLIHGQVSGDHALRDYVEMKAHDVAIEHLREIVSDVRRPLSEADIRDLNRILLKEPFRKDAITPDGQPTRIEILPGEYKMLPNNVRTASGEIFRFADPVDVVARMAAMLANLHQMVDEGTLHPVEIASWLHHEFVLIHPFGDGNGRTARLLVNYVLMRVGYVPLIVPTERKDSYLAALRLADAGDLAPLTGFLSDCSKVALQRGIRAAKGESIEEDGDLEKEIEVFKRIIASKPRKVVPKSNETVRTLYLECLRPLLLEFVRTMRRIDGLFAEKRLTFNGNPIPEDLDEAAAFLAKLPSDLSFFEVYLSYEWGGYVGESVEGFGERAYVGAFFHEFDYIVEVSDVAQKRLAYDSILTEKLISDLCRESLSKIFERIKQRANGTE